MDLAKYTKRISAEMGKLGFGGAKAAAEVLAPDAAEQPMRRKGDMESASSMAKILAGEIGSIGEFYFPGELIGGSCPRVIGEEEEIVWNAAAEACDTERVHVVWQSVENKIWYLAVRSNGLASHPNTWCPFASLLPGMKDASVPPVCYTHYGDDLAAMMTVTSDGLQIYRGTSLVVRAKAERTARELGDAPIIELVPDRILGLTPVPWYSLSLFEDRARRILAGAAVFTAIALAVMSFLVWLLASMVLITSKHNMAETLQHTQDKTTELMRTVETLRASPVRDQLEKFANVNDGLLTINGLLEVYEIKGNNARWRAQVPPNVTADRINDLGGHTIDTTDKAVIIGNTAEIEHEAALSGKK